MALTASPFNPQTGELLPVYRDAYLRGDLSRLHAQQVDAHLAKHRALGDDTWQRFHAMQQSGELVTPVGWMQGQMQRARTATKRTRNQIGALTAVAVCVGSMVFAGALKPTAPVNFPTATEATAGAPAAEASAVRMTMVRGKILNENGRPMIGATVIQKGSDNGVSTDANGEYALLVPAGRSTTLAYDYAGYTGDEVVVSSGVVRNMTLVPAFESATKPAHKTKRWFFFN